MQVCGEKREGVPGVGDDDVVEGCVALAKAREADFEDHLVVRQAAARSMPGR